MNVPVRDNELLAKVLELVNDHVELNTIWTACNIMAVDRLGMSDHGPTHVSIVANIALKILRNLVKNGVETSIVKDWHFSEDDAEVVVFLASIMHDLGNSVHRDLHDDVGFVLAHRILHELLEKVYSDPAKRQVIITETLHAMVAHDTDVSVHTVEGGVVRIADGLDMEKGRARIGFEAGTKDIHSVSAMAIEDVKILPPTRDKPVRVEILMTEAAGIFQVDYLLKKKITGSGLERYVEVIAKQVSLEGHKNILDTYKL